QCPPEPHLTPQGILNSHTPASIANSPFMVGVSGHRDLEPDELPRLREAVTGFVRQLREQLPDTELRIIVGMAQGADLLVAQTAARQTSPAAPPTRCFVISVPEPTRATLWNPSSSSRRTRNPTVPSRWCTGHPPRAAASPGPRTPAHPASCSVSERMCCRCSTPCRRG